MKNECARKTAFVRGVSRVGLFSLFLFATNVLGTTSMRCGSHIVDQGTPKSEVREKCGEPAATEDGGRTWVYDFGSGQLLKVIRFVQDEVEFIEDRSRD